jgi:RNA recognition motif-containing protein
LYVNHGLVSCAADVHSVYIKNLPTNITPAEVEEEFVRFGPIKPGGVNVRSQKLGVCYAFVEFENTSSAQSAIEASPVSIGGRPAYVEEKRTMGSRGLRISPCHSGPLVN